MKDEEGGTWTSSRRSWTFVKKIGVELYSQKHIGELNHD